MSESSEEIARRLVRKTDARLVAYRAKAERRRRMDRAVAWIALSLSVAALVINSAGWLQ